MSTKSSITRSARASNLRRFRDTCANSEDPKAVFEAMKYASFPIRNKAAIRLLQMNPGTDMLRYVVCRVHSIRARLTAARLFVKTGEATEHELRYMRSHNLLD